MPNAHVLRGACRVRDHHLDPRQVRHPADQPGDDGAAGRDPREFAELDEAKDDAREAEEEFKAQIADARKQAGKIREEAKEQGDQIVAEAREQAQVEAKRIVDHGHAQLEAERKQALASLRAEVGTLATELAGRIVGESLEDDDRANRVVDRFLADLETMETAEAAAKQNGSH